MRPSNIIFAVMLTACIGLGPAGPASGEEKVRLRLATVPEFTPFVWTDPSGKAKGIDVDIVREMCRRMDMDCRLQFVPWPRVLSRIRSGSVDGGFAGFRTRERRAFAHFPAHPLHFSTYSLFVKAGEEFDFSKTEDLYGKTIGINRGFRINDEFHRAVDQGRIKVQEVNSLEQNIRKLLAGGRIDAVAANHHKLRRLINGMGVQCELTCLPVPITPPRPSYLMISRLWDHPRKTEILRQIDTTLKTMYDDGTIEQINTAYLD